MGATRITSGARERRVDSGEHLTTGAIAPGEIERIVSLFRQRLVSEGPLFLKGFSFTVIGEEDGKLRLEPVAPVTPAPGPTPARLGPL